MDEPDASDIIRGTKMVRQLMVAGVRQEIAIDVVKIVLIRERAPLEN